MEPGKTEQFLSYEETLLWLIKWLKTFEVLPKDLKNYGSLNETAKRLIDTACDLEIESGFKLQWFAIRLEPPSYRSELIDPQ